MPNTVYKLSIKPGFLKDIHGQVLVDQPTDQLIEFHVGEDPGLIGHISGATGKSFCPRYMSSRKILYCDNYFN